MTWKKKLTKGELKHIKETTKRSTLREFLKNRVWQKTQNITCYDCRHIAFKLGLEN